jgi:hypothetical protein
MTTAPPEQASLRSILLGIALFVILFLAFFRIPDVVKFSGAALMYLPSRLGLIDMVLPKDVVALPLDENPSAFTISAPGRYVMYLNNYDLLIVHDAVVAGNSDPWMNIQSEDLGTPVKVNLIGRGLSWYDTPFARGRPVVTFEIDQPGTYQFMHPTRPDMIYLLPDTVTGNESRITFWVLFEIAIIGGAVFYIFRRRTASKRELRLKSQADNRARVENTWKRIETRKEEKQREEDQPYWKKH